MKLSVEFPSVSYREGPAAVATLARAIERIGYDHIDIFDHVVMGGADRGARARPLQSPDADPRGPDGARLHGRGHHARDARRRGAGPAAAPARPGGQAA